MIAGVEEPLFAKYALAQLWRPRVVAEKTSQAIYESSARRKALGGWM